MSSVQQWACLSSSQVDFSWVPQVCFLKSSHFLWCMMDVSHPHSSLQWTRIHWAVPAWTFRRTYKCEDLSVLVKYKQTSQEAALCASPMHRKAWGNSARLENQPYSKEVASLLASSAVSILSFMTQSLTDTAKPKNKQRGFWAHQHLSCLFRAKMLKIPHLFPFHISWAHGSYCISPAFIWPCFWSHWTEEAE